MTWWHVFSHSQSLRRENPKVWISNLAISSCWRFPKFGDFQSLSISRVWRCPYITESVWYCLLWRRFRCQIPVSDLVCNSAVPTLPRPSLYISLCPKTSLQNVHVNVPVHNVIHPTTKKLRVYVRHTAGSAVFLDVFTYVQLRVGSLLLHLFADHADLGLLAVTRCKRSE
jgi:hypothetical protein